ncbi:MAG: hypothetical protein ACD_84C00013G0004 [uncultured bacterium]|nr:MAG: hypothetical protein ACD_84C00013G0004 [uncultured bacterium]
MNYLECITKYYPNVFVTCQGDVNTYADIQWAAGDPIPTQAELDIKIFTYLKSAKIEELSEACQADIMAGFNSMALGTLHRYDSHEEDQLNLIGTVTKTAPTPAALDGTSYLYASREIINGVEQPKTYLMHTHAQLRQVLDDGATYKLMELVKFNTKKMEVLAMTTVAELDTVIWVD